MDYSSYFAATPQALQFFGLPHTPGFGDEGKLETPVDAVDAAFFPPYDFRFSQPQIPQQQTSLPPQTQASPLIPASATSTSGPDGSPPSLPPAGMSAAGSVDSGVGMDSMSNLQMDNEQGRTRSSSEEKEILTPAQSRRKAQNRAAQRAFRERKERHVRDLEAKLSALESSATSLATDNERLKLALQRATTENEILRATTSSSHRLSVGSSLDGSESGGMRTLGGVMGKLPNETSAGSAVAAAQALLARSNSTTGGEGDALNHDRISQALDSNLNISLSLGSDATNGLVNGATNNAVYPHGSTSAASMINPFFPSTTRASSAFLPAAATWDLIQAHPLVKQGVVDIADVCEALRGTARCDGQGPVFREEMVWRAVEGARRGGGDELI